MFLDPELLLPDQHMTLLLAGLHASTLLATPEEEDEEEADEDEEDDEDEDEDEEDEDEEEE